MSLSVFSVLGFSFTSVFGSLLHFVYDWTGKCIAVAPFSAVNESIWEHMKLLFYPMFVFGLIGYRLSGEDFGTFWWSAFSGTVAGLLLIPILYYSYTGAFGKNSEWFNIAIFFIAAGIGYYVQIKLLGNEYSFSMGMAGFVIMCVIAVMFIVMTFVQPQLPIFKDPGSGTYGI